MDTTFHPARRSISFFQTFFAENTGLADDQRFNSEGEALWKEHRIRNSFYDSPCETGFLSATEKTFQWFARAACHAELVSSQRTILRLTGSPGTGKSHLLAWMASSGHHTHGMTSAPLIFYYSSTCPQGSNSRVDELLDSLLYSIFLDDPSQKQRLWSMLRVQHAGTAVTWPIEEFLRMIREALIDAATKKPVFRFIDGLDELLREDESQHRAHCLRAFLATLIEDASRADTS